jgi:phosphotriesterase-related protein
MIDRRAFLRISAAAVAMAAAGCATTQASTSVDGKVMTVRGLIDAADMGLTLPHEHIIASFQAYEEWVRAPTRYDQADVIRVVLPHLRRIRELGCRTFVDPTAAYLGRAPLLLRRLSELSGLHILTVTGNYAADHFRHLPPWVYSETPDQLAQRYVAEWRDGIADTGISPGFIKLGFDGGALNAVERNILCAAILAHSATGLTIGAHTGTAGAGRSAFEQLAMIHEMGMEPSGWIWIHAHNEPDMGRHVEAARQGAWVEFDGLRDETFDRHITLVANMRDAHLLDHVLVSQDAGWYHVGQSGGGNFRAYDLVLTRFIPALRANGCSQDEIDLLFIHNPARAFSLKRPT